MSLFFTSTLVLTVVANHYSKTAAPKLSSEDSLSDCGSGCSDCINNMRCISCVDAHVLVDGICVYYKEIDHCLEAKDSKCSVCVPMYQIISDGQACEFHFGTTPIIFCVLFGFLFFLIAAFASYYLIRCVVRKRKENRHYKIPKVEDSTPIPFIHPFEEEELRKQVLQEERKEEELRKQVQEEERKKEELRKQVLEEERKKEELRKQVQEERKEEELRKQVLQEERKEEELRKQVQVQEEERKEEELRKQVQEEERKKEELRKQVLEEERKKEELRKQVQEERKEEELTKTIFDIDERKQIKEWTQMKFEKVLFDSNVNGWDQVKQSVKKKSNDVKKQSNVVKKPAFHTIIISQSNLLFFIEEEEGDENGKKIKGKRFGGFVNAEISKMFDGYVNSENKNNAFIDDPKAFLFSLEKGSFEKFPVAVQSKAFCVHGKKEKELFQFGDFDVVVSKKTTKCEYRSKEDSFRSGEKKPFGDEMPLPHSISQLVVFQLKPKQD